jgi:formiminotetrahydrofolate cyclodeaminase
MRIEECSINEILSEIGRVSPHISGSTAALIAAQLGLAMARMAFLVSARHGANVDLEVALLDSLAQDIKAATDRDQQASSALIESSATGADEDSKISARIDATHEPLAAAHLLIETLEFLRENSDKIRPAVASDHGGAIQLIGAAFAAVMMAVDTNLESDGMTIMRERTEQDRARLHAAHMKLLSDRV